MQNDGFLTLITQFINLPDLIILTLVLLNILLGLKRGLFGALYGLVGKIITLTAAFFTARAAAPTVAKWIVTPIVGDLFEKQASVHSAAGLLGGLRQSVTEAAISMAESIAFLLLFLLAVILFGWIIALIAKSLHFLAHLTPLGILDSLAGGALGLVTGVALIALLLLGINWFSPITFTSLGYLSPERVSHTVLLAQLMDVLPIAI